MATLTTSWDNYGKGTWTSPEGSKVNFYIDAKYETQSIENNSTTTKSRNLLTLNNSVIII